ncbi:hypothetical protein [Nocardia sp. NPDC049707]|uniref:hypothetical protein n=1 Tax=Nocardia sp. NPDC049707 TaxID=3154735 RepID=UPI003419543A
MSRAGATVAHHNERWLGQSWHPEQAFAVLGAITCHRVVHCDSVTALRAVGLWP